MKNENQVLELILNEIEISNYWDETLENMYIDYMYYTELGIDANIEQLKYICAEISKVYNIKVLNSEYTRIRVVK
ncbi:MAG: hypothetical protein ACRCX2_30040 [Paraclostridium sp.]